jgi:hypothetical protein
MENQHDADFFTTHALRGKEFMYVVCFSASGQRRVHAAELCSQLSRWLQLCQVAILLDAGHDSVAYCRHAGCVG